MWSIKSQIQSMPGDISKEGRFMPPIFQAVHWAATDSAGALQAGLQGDLPRAQHGRGARSRRWFLSFCGGCIYEGNVTIDLLHCFFDALNISFTKLMFVARKYHASNFHSRCFGVMRSIVNTALRLLLSSAYYEAIFSVWSGVKCILSRRHSASQLNGRSWEGAGWWSQTDLPVKLLPWLPDHLSLSRLAPCSRHVSDGQ